MTAPEPRRGMPSPRLTRSQFRDRFLAQFADPVFASLVEELDRVEATAWDAYSQSGKSPRTRRAGDEFADPSYELSTDWLAARDAVHAAQRRHEDAALQEEVRNAARTLLEAVKAKRGGSLLAAGSGLRSPRQK